MSNNNKKLTVDVSYECWKRLKVTSIEKEITLQQVVKDILEKSVQVKSDK